MMDGSIAKDAITHVAHLTFRIKDTSFTEKFYVINAGSHPMALGLPWLKKHNPNIDWTRGKITELRAGPHKGKILARAGTPTSMDVPLPRDIFVANRYLHATTHDTNSAWRHYDTVISVGAPEDRFPTPEDPEHGITLLGPGGIDDLTKAEGCETAPIPEESARKGYFLDGEEIPADLVNEYRNSDAWIQVSTLVRARNAVVTRLAQLSSPVVPARSASVNGLTGNAENWLETIPPQHRHFAATVFSDESAKKLPPHRAGIDCQIDIKEGETLSTSKIYDMSKEQLDTLKAIIDEQLSKGFIRPSKSPASSPVFFVKDKASASRGVEQLRLVVDYRSLNSKIVMDEYPIPLTRTVMQRLPTAKIFTKFDVRAGFNNLRIREGDEWKTAFKTFFGLYEYTVMPFGLATAPSTFQRFINHVLAPYLDDFCFAYLDDIIIFSPDQATHDKHVTLVLEALQAAELHLKPAKCQWSATEVSFLGFTAVAGKGIRMSDDKLQGLREWRKPETVKQVRMFLGTVNFYHDFVPHYSDIVAPLTDLTKKDVPFVWTDRHDMAWDRLMALLRSDVFLAAFDPELPTILETDASDVAYAGVISQLSNGKYRPILMYSHKFQDAETRYSVAEKELYAIVFAIKRYPYFLHAKTPLKVYTDHRNLARFLFTTKLTSRLGRWYDDIRSSGIDFTIEYRPGMENTVADALSRYQKDASADGPAYAPLLPRHRFSPKALQDIDQVIAEISAGKSGDLEIPSRAGKPGRHGRLPRRCNHVTKFGFCAKCFKEKSDPATRLASYGNTEATELVGAKRDKSDRHCLGYKATPATTDIRFSHGEGPPELSNFYPKPVLYLGKTFASVEHGYQAAKAAGNRSAASRIENASTAKLACQIGKSIPGLDRDAWAVKRTNVMRGLLRAKFAHGTPERRALDRTAPHRLIDCGHGKFWGIGRDGTGRNTLGRLLEEIRDEDRRGGLRRRWDHTTRRMPSDTRSGNASTRSTSSDLEVRPQPRIIYENNMRGIEI